MSSFSVYIIDNSDDTRTFCESFSDIHDAIAEAEVIRESIEIEGSSDDCHVVVEVEP